MPGVNSTYQSWQGKWVTELCCAAQTSLQIDKEVPRSLPQLIAANVIAHLNGDPEGKAITFTNQQGAGVLVEEIGAMHKIRILHWPV